MYLSKWKYHDQYVQNDRIQSRGIVFHLLGGQFATYYMHM